MEDEERHDLVISNRKCKKNWSFPRKIESNFFFTLKLEKSNFLEESYTEGILSRQIQRTSICQLTQLIRQLQTKHSQPPSLLANSSNLSHYGRFQSVTRPDR